MNIEEAVSQYRDQFLLYEEFTRRIDGLLKELLRIHNITDFNLEPRTKDVEHFREKITRAGKSYKNPLIEVTDLCGVRVIVRQASDLSKVVEIIRSEFHVDESNSVYKAEELDVDQFGYISIHIVVSISSQRTILKEWERFQTLKAEIQIRTILQHAWATISHDLDYKKSVDMPGQLRRRLFRLSALLELADDELDRLVAERRNQLEIYRTNLEQGDTQIELNIDSLRVYVETADEVQYWIKYLRNSIGVNVETWGDLSRDLRIAEFCGLTSLDDVRRLMISARGWGERFYSEYYQEYVKREHVKPNQLTVVLNAPVTQLMIASYAERFTPAILDSEFGYGSTVILDAARNARGENRH